VKLLNGVGVHGCGLYFWWWTLFPAFTNSNPRYRKMTKLIWIWDHQYCNCWSTCQHIWHWIILLRVNICIYNIWLYIIYVSLWN
jgi:hypothetical protein